MIVRGTSELEPGTLWHRVLDRTERALQTGALQPIPTEYEFVEQGGIRFLVRKVANLARKEAAKQKQERTPTTDGKPFNPFLPYEEALFVANLSATHLCLLNKFNVVDHHLLMVTRSYEEQESLLTWQDFEAAWLCLAEFEGLVFYNGGALAGASQPHKHLQLLPLPLAPDGPPIPIAPLLAPGLTGDTRENGEAGEPCERLPFRHALARLNPAWVHTPAAAAAATLACYHKLLTAIGIQGVGENPTRQSAAYNLLMTREWLLVVPRSQEQFHSIAINSVGFAGVLLVRNEEQLQILKDCGPLTALTQVA